MKMRLRHADSFQQENSNTVDQSLQFQDSVRHIVEDNLLKSEHQDEKRHRKVSTTQTKQRGSELPLSRKKNKRKYRCDDSESDLSLDFADIVIKQRESLENNEEKKLSQEIESQVLITSVNP